MKKVFVICLAVLFIAANALASGTITGGKKTVTAAGTAEALSSTSTYVYDLELRALDNNTGSVYIGGSDVDKTTKNGAEIDEDSDVPWKIREADLSKVYIDADVNTDGVGYTYRQ